MSSLDEAVRMAKEAADSLNNMVSTSEMTSMHATTMYTMWHDISIQLKRKELFECIASLSSPEFAKTIQEKTSSEKNGYSVELELEIQERICIILCYGVMSEDEILNAMEDGSFGWTIIALTALLHILPTPKNVFDEWPLTTSDDVIRAYASGTVVQPVNASNWKCPSVASVQKYIQEADEPARKNIWRQNDEQEDPQEETPDAVDQGSGEHE